MICKLVLFTVALTTFTLTMAAPTPEENLLVEVGDLQQKWTEWKTKHGKSYQTPEEESKKFDTFKENVAKIVEHNKKYQTGETTYTQGLNQFADLNQEEFAETYLGGKSKKPGLLGAA